MTSPQRFPAPVRRPAAIHGEAVPIDKSALLVVGKEGYREGNIVGCSEPSHRYTASDIGVSVSSTGLIGGVHLGLHPAGAHGVHPHTSPAPFCGKRSRQTDQPMLRRVVRRTIGNAHKSSHGSYVDNATAPRVQHLLAEGLG